jgi:hypothetical protein
LYSNFSELEDRHKVSHGTSVAEPLKAFRKNALATKFTYKKEVGRKKGCGVWDPPCANKYKKG